MPASAQSGALSPAWFIAKWSRTELSESAASQEHFLDLCRMLGHAKLDRAVVAAYAATDPDPEADWREDWADLWQQTGPGQPLPENHPDRDRREQIDQTILANLLRLNRHRTE